MRSLNVDGGSITVEAEDLASGLYFVRLQAGDRTSTQSLTLVR